YSAERARRESNPEAFYKPAREWRARNPEKVRDQGRTYYREHREQVLARTSAYHREHPDVQRRAWRDYKQRHRERLLPLVRERAARWRAQNRARDVAASSRWRKNNPERHKAIIWRRNAKLRALKGSFTAEDWSALKARYDYRCLCCGRREPEIVLSVDHVVPISLGGSNTIDNIQPLCKPCNSSKGNRHTTDYR